MDIITFYYKDPDLYYNYCITHGIEVNGHDMCCWLSKKHLRDLCLIPIYELSIYRMKDLLIYLLSDLYGTYIVETATYDTTLNLRVDRIYDILIHIINKQKFDKKIVLEAITEDMLDIEYNGYCLRLTNNRLYRNLKHSCDISFYNNDIFIMPHMRKDIYKYYKHFPRPCKYIIDFSDTVIYTKN